MPNVFIREDEDPDYDVYISQDKVVIYLDLRGKEVTYNRILIKSDGEKIYILNSVNNSIVKIIALPTRIDSSTVTFNYKNGIFIIQGNKVN
ncbi:hypothetical protein BFU36_03550 [Sulfolobus sp. A20]|uniref:Hsp20/alpha crystallin family protein n=1 Tax=Sulfolobaceae TaxID=118883 RepID=UPI000845C9EB|nr:MULTISPECIES: Hsp20/alpha crystallin family protein [unclassified Sulfolobus]TRM75022.1 Hsp20/alpha crystallin family protein [Sulfolobus sp. E5]TRM78523.1 Hsp20/alpha crystallin family protein [Sulfolobus sp. A20-N-F8]TRM79252.1 Hsp20/alpha crystallin family protein [Sulfolobus sp. B5]TRM82344.1 Hsp20/alpha crystallin family protein [Sulfolobus sp. D5]TRM89845.1 Hsp20/alpha crystallin family protein [Sulfolobus sp. C3]TRM95362.1 Hsp20/alpha crystallin family protein [Sulfolobus sp. A20-N-